MNAWRAMVPRSLVLPAQHTDAAITVRIEVTDDGEVRAAGLPALGEALYRGSLPLVDQFCAMWTQWLSRVERQAVSG